MSFAPNASPFNSLPRVVVLLTLAVMGMELVFWLAQAGLAGGVTDQGSGLRGYALENYAYFPQIADLMWQRSEFPLSQLLRFVTYPFVHFSAISAIFTIVFTLALGKMVGEVFSGAMVLAVFFGAAVAGALVYTLVLSDTVPLIGGMPAAYGLIGAYTFILWVGYGAQGANQFQAFRLIGFLLAIQLLFGLLFGSNNTWVAEVAGFIAGFVIAAIARPGGVARLLARTRSR